MGTTTISASLESFSKNDQPVPEYLWIDPNIDTKHNKHYQSCFDKSKHKVAGFKQLDALEQRLKKLDKNQRVRVICAASCQDVVYQFIESHELIERAVLFCAFKEKANKLMRSYAKIKGAYFHFQKLLSLMDQWERQNNKSAFFCKEHEIGRLHRGMISLYTIIGNDDILSPDRQRDKENKAKFNEYCNKCMTTGSLSDIDYIRNKITDRSSFASYFIAKNFIADNINELLRCTSSPTKLEYLRWPVSNLYHYIKKQYKNAKVVTCFSMLMFTREELSRMQVGNYFWLNQFVVADLNQNDVKNYKDGSIMAEIRLDIGAHCNGFCEKDKRILVNIGNYFQVVSYDSKKQQIVLKMIVHAEKLQLKSRDKSSQTLLSHLRIKKQGILEQGQWYSLMLGGKKEDAQKYITESGKVSQNQKENKLKWLCERCKVQYLLGTKLKKCLEQINHEISHGKYEDANCQAALEPILTMLRLQDQKQSILTQFPAIKNVFSAFKDKNASNDRQSALSAGIRVISDNCDKNVAENALIKLETFERSLLKDPRNIVSDDYYLTLSIRSKCYNVLNDHHKQIEVLDHLLWLIGWSEGRQCIRFKNIIKQKRIVYESMHREKADQDEKKKSELKSSNIPLADLLKLDSEFKLDFIDLAVDLQE